MKRVFTLTFIIMTVALFSASSMAGKPDKKGNGLPFVDMSDSWTLVIHSRPYDKCPTSEYEGTNRRSIVVAALPGFDGTSNPHAGNLPDASDYNDIELESNDSLDEFSVIDGNACDLDPARLSLPIAVATNYDLYIKLIGKPNEATAAALCADLALDLTEDIYCNVGSVRIRSKSGDHYVNVTDELLYLQNVTSDDCGAAQTVPLFDACIENEFWDWSATEKAKSRIIFVPAN